MVDGASGYTTGASGYTKKSNIVSVPVPLRDLERPREARPGKGQVRDV